jgi:hypothetical protein
LAELPTEEVANPDVGAYEDAQFEGGEVKETQKGGFMIVAKFTAPRASGNGLIRHTEFINLAMPDSHPRVKQMAQGWYRSFGVIPSGTKNIPLIRDKSEAEKLVAAINSNSGTQVGISLHEDDNGFLRARPLRK